MVWTQQELQNSQFTRANSCEAALQFSFSVLSAFSMFDDIVLHTAPGKHPGAEERTLKFFAGRQQLPEPCSMMQSAHHQRSSHPQDAVDVLHATQRARRTCSRPSGVPEAPHGCHPVPCQVAEYWDSGRDLQRHAITPWSPHTRYGLCLSSHHVQRASCSSEHQAHRKQRHGPAEVSLEPALHGGSQLLCRSCGCCKRP